MPAYSFVRACMLDSKGLGWHQAPRWFHLKCIINCFEENIWSLNCLCIVVCFYWLPLKSYIILRNIILKGFWYPALYSDWYPMLLFESSLSSAFWNGLSYSVIRAYSVSDFDKCSTLLRQIWRCARSPKLAAASSWQGGRGRPIGGILWRMFMAAHFC